MANPRRHAYQRLHREAKKPGDLRARCFYCNDECFHKGANRGTIEHLLPKALGGTHTRDNMRLAHIDCNNAVANLPVEVKMALAGNMKRGEVPGWVREQFAWVANSWRPIP